MQWNSVGFEFGISLDFYALPETAFVDKYSQTTPGKPEQRGSGRNKLR